jgi:hypothetical protein
MRVRCRTEDACAAPAPQRLTRSPPPTPLPPLSRFPPSRPTPLIPPPPPPHCSNPPQGPPIVATRRTASRAPQGTPVFYLRIRRHLLVGPEPRVCAPLWSLWRARSSCFNKKRSMAQGGEYCTQGVSGRVRGASRPPDRAACRSLS